MQTQALKVKGIKPVNQQSTSQAFSGKLFINQLVYKQFLQWNLNKEPIYCTINGFIFTLASSEGYSQQQAGLSKIQRQELKVSLIEDIELVGYKPEIDKEFRLGSLKIELELLQGIQNKVEVDEDQVSELIRKTYREFFFCPQQLYFLDYQGNSLLLRVQATSLMEIGEVKQSAKYRTTDVPGMLVDETDIKLIVKNSQFFCLKQSEERMVSIFTDEFDFEKMGIGGLDTELLNIFRRAFASRRFPTHVLEKYGIQHVKGVLLFGPPGTGKTLIARELGKALRAKEPKIVNGPEIMSKYVGEAEERIRKLFEDAISDQREFGSHSDLHIIIFDELDSICRPRGTINSGTGIHDTMVNQLLSMIDGVNALNNVLVIGMTNRKDLIDEAVLRPGRFEVHIEVMLPDEHGRQQIFKIHTKKIVENKLVQEEVKLSKLAEMTKNYTGAEIEAVVKSAASFAFFRGKDISDFAKTATITENNKISMKDFEQALEEVKPQFGVDQDKFEILVRNDIYNYGQKFSQILTILQSSIEQVKFGKSSQLHTVLLEGDNGVGKTAIAASMALKCQFPFVKLVSPENFVGYTENGKINAMVKIFDDAYKSPLSCIIMDNIERLIEFIDIGPRFSNTILQAVLVLLKRVPKIQSNRLLIVGTTSSAKILKDLEITQSFNLIIHIPLLAEPSDIFFVLKELVGKTGIVIDQQKTQEIEKISRNVKDIPIKKLIMLVDMAIEGTDQLNYNKFMLCYEASVLMF